MSQHDPQELKRDEPAAAGFTPERLERIGEVLDAEVDRARMPALLADDQSPGTAGTCSVTAPSTGVPILGAGWWFSRLASQHPRSQQPSIRTGRDTSRGGSSAG
jgi:hypothetical protein